MKKIEDITFNDDILTKCKDDIEKINTIYEKLEKDRSVQKAYKKYLKSKKRLEYNYNKNTNSTNNYNPLISNRIFMKIHKCQNTKYDCQIEGKFC